MEERKNKDFEDLLKFWTQSKRSYKSSNLGFQEIKRCGFNTRYRYSYYYSAVSAEVGYLGRDEETMDVGLETHSQFQKVLQKDKDIVSLFDQYKGGYWDPLELEKKLSEINKGEEENVRKS